MSVAWRPSRYGLTYPDGSPILSPVYVCGCGAEYQAPGEAHGCHPDPRVAAIYAAAKARRPLEDPAEVVPRRVERLADQLRLLP